jgi:hypothetical protein
MTPEWTSQLARQLGYEPNVVEEIRLLPTHIEVVYFLKNEDGHKFTVSDGHGKRIAARETRRHGYPEVSIEQLT